jgi:hypothetical protein
MGQVTARVYRVGSSARAVSDAIDAWYRDIDALRSADGDAADPGVRTEEREPGV